MRSDAMRFLTASVLCVGLGSAGCTGRLIGEGLGAAMGASGKVVDLKPPQPGSLSAYKGFRIESIRVSDGLKAPANLPELLRTELMNAAAKKGLTPGGTPGLVLSGEVLNYESAGAVDTAIGPLEEVILRATLIDAETKEVLASGNLIGRAKSTTASGAKNLSEGAGKALKKWLKAGGIEKDEDEEKKSKNKKD